MFSTIANLLAEHPWVLIALVVHGAVLGTVAYLILLERKVASWAQDRIGPNRVGPGGLLQPLADGLKFIVKEDYRPAGVDRALFSIAPAVMILTIIVSIAVIPWGGTHQVTRTLDVTGQTTEQVNASAAAIVPVNGDLVTTTLKADAGKTLADVTYRYPFQIARLNIGVLFIIATLSLAVYGIVLGGWASNNKYSFLGALRATAQMVSYEIPLGLSLLTIVLMFGTLDLGEIVDRQAHYWLGFIPAWNVFCQPLAFVIFLTCIHAEANRAPFDVAEAEQELVGGYHTEYSSMRFALFFLAEYAGMITTSALCVALFFGGWHFPGLGSNIVAGEPSVTNSLLVCLLRSGVFFVKTLAVIFVFMWVRWSLPRFRFDQIMMLAWRAMVPISLALLIATAVVIYVFGALYGADGRAFMRVGGKMALVLLVVNVAVTLVTAFVSLIIPPAPATNRKVCVPGSRFTRTPLPASVTAARAGA